MAYKKFSDFTVFDPPDISDYLVGYRELGGEFRSSLQNITEIFKKFSAPSLPNTLFVNMSGNDSALGNSESFAFRTIKRAMAKALEISRNIPNSSLQNEEINGWGTSPNLVNVFVRAGEYVEDNPIYIPPGVTLVGENVNAVTILPKNKFYDIFWVNNNTSIQGVTFKDYYSPAYAVAYPEFGYLKNENTSNYPSTRVLAATAKAFSYYNLNNSKYPTTKISKANNQNFSIDSGQTIFDPFKIAFLGRYYRNIENNEIFYTNEERIKQKDFYETAYYNLSGGVDKPYVLLSPYIFNCRSITVENNLNLNDAGGTLYVNGDFVDGPLRLITIESCEHFNQGGKGIHATNNGVADIINNSTICCSEGFISTDGGTCIVNGSNCTFGLSGLVSIGRSPKPTMIGTLNVDILSGTPTNIFPITNLGSPELSARQQFPNNITPYIGQVFQIIDTHYLAQTSGINYLSANNSGTYFVVQSASNLRPAVFPNKGFECDIVVGELYSVENDTSTQTQAYIPNFIYGLNSGSEVLFYLHSSIVASSQTFNNIGTGTHYLSAIPQDGAIPNDKNETKHDLVGKILFNSSNQNGNNKFGNNIILNQVDGSIELNNLNAKDIKSDNIVVTTLSALSAFIDVININKYEISGFDVKGDFEIEGNSGLGVAPNSQNRLTIVGNVSSVGDIRSVGNVDIVGDVSVSKLYSSISNFDNSYVLDLSSYNLSATNISTYNLSAENISIDILNANTSYFDELTATNSRILSADLDYIYNKKTETLFLSALSSNLDYIYTNEIFANNFTAGNFNTYGIIVSYLSALSADIGATGNLTVSGDIIVRDKVLTSGGHSHNWNSTYNTVSALSALWGDESGSVSKLYVDGKFLPLSSTLTNPKYESVFTSVNVNSANWDSVYSSFNANSADYTTFNYVDSNFLNLTGGTITGKTRINADLTVYGNLSATGNSYFANTIYSTTSALSVVNIGNTGPALYVGNNGTGDIASFYDIDTNIEILHVGGDNGSFPNVGVRTSTPNKTFTVNGEISAYGSIWTSGDLVSAGKELFSIIYPDINKGLNVYNTVNSNSANWDSVYTSVNSVSSNWDSLYTSVNSVYTSVKDTSANWDSVYTSVKDTSANWDSVYTSFNTNSGDYTTFNYVDTNFLNLTGGSINGSLSANGSLTVDGKIYGTIIDWMTLTRGYMTTPTLLGTTTESGDAGDVYEYIFESSPSNITYYRFISTNGQRDEYYANYITGTLSNLIVKKKIIL